MKLETIEKGVRAAGAAGALVSAVAVYSGLVRGLRHPKGRVVGPAPAVARALAGGSMTSYLAASIPALGLLYWLWRPLPVSLSATQRAVATLLGALLYFPGLALMVWGRLTMGEMHNVSTSLAVQLYADHRLVSSGPFGWVRHPMYVGGMMAELGALLLYRTWTTLLIALNVPALLLRARREEEALAAEFGEQWVEYQQRVPAWIPRLARQVTLS